MKNVFLIWLHPWILAIGLPALAAAAFAWPRRPRLALPLSAAAACADLDDVAARRGRRWRGALLVASGFLLVAAAAGPRTLARAAPTTEGITLALVLDVSGSMATPDFSLDGQEISRLAGVQRIFRLLVEGGTADDGPNFPGRPNDRIALVVFATRPETACPPTLDHAALLRILDRQKPRTVVNEATSNPGDALAWALASLESAPTRRKAIVLVTDGESNVPPPALSTRQAATLAKRLGVPVYAIDALDDAEAGPDAEHGRQALRELAETTGGRSFHAADATSLRRALFELDRLERDALDLPDVVQYQDRSGSLAFLAFALWLGSLVPTARGRSVP